MRILQTVGVAFLLIVVFILPTYASQPLNKYRVLVLHSFHKGQKWNDDLSRGIESILKSNTIELNFEFMDTIRNLENNHIKNLIQLYQYKYKTRKVDIVISTDERALEFLLTNRGDVFPQASIVFCAIKSYEEKFGEEKLTGVIESVDIQSNVLLAMKFNPSLKNIFVVFDNTPTSVSLIYPLIKIIKAFSSRISFQFTEFVPIEELQRNLQVLTPDTAVFLINYTRDKKGRVISMDESAKLITDSSPVPVYTLWDSYMGKGILGGKLVSGFTQGRTAAKIALRILQGEDPTKIPVQISLPSQYIFDYQKLKKFNIKESKLPENSVIYNLPHTFYRQYKQLIIMVIVGGILLTLIIIVLSMNIMRRRRVERALKTYSNRLNFLHRLDQSILNNFSLENISDNILGPSLKLFDCHLIGIFLLGTEFIPAEGLAHLKNGRNRIIKDLCIQKDHLPMEMLRDGGVVRLNRDQSENVGFLVNRNDFESIDNYLLIPLVFQDQLLGLLFLGNTPEKVISYDTETTFRQVADSLAMAVQNDYFLEEIKGHEAELRRMSLNILNVQEKERQHLSAELHDEFGQTLTAIGLNLSVIRKKLDKPQPVNIKPRLEEVEKSIELLSEQVHDLSLDLRPPMLDDLGLVPTLRWYLNQYKDRSGLNIDVSVSKNEDITVPRTVSVAMYRVLQEALNNVTKHAKAVSVTVQLVISVMEVKLRITDDGIGFDNSELRSQKQGMHGLGLIGMRERLEVLGGSLKIQTAKKNGGTTLLAVSPIRGEDSYEDN